MESGDNYQFLADNQQELIHLPYLKFKMKNSKITQAIVKNV
jgi:hypothetical protein